MVWLFEYTGNGVARPQDIPPNPVGRGWKLDRHGILCLHLSIETAFTVSGFEKESCGCIPDLVNPTSKCKSCKCVKAGRFCSGLCGCGVCNNMIGDDFEETRCFSCQQANNDMQVVINDNNNVLLGEEDENSGDDDDDDENQFLFEELNENSDEDLNDEQENSGSDDEENDEEEKE